MKTFSQRKGLTPVSEIIQVDSMSAELRNSLWNVLDIHLWSSHSYLYSQHGTPEIDNFSISLWFNFFKKPIDSRPNNSRSKLDEIRTYFYSNQWFHVYDFLEFVVNNYSRSRPDLEKALNQILERELSGYRFVSGKVIDITNKEEIDMLAEALSDSRFSGVASHLRRALELIADREHPDYRNSIKESISAVESMARIIGGDSTATLGVALKALEKNGKLHPALRDGFLKLYGYTSDEQGIRHAMLDEPKLSSADAKYFLLSCTSFVNYLKAQM